MKQLLPLTLIVLVACKTKQNKELTATYEEIKKIETVIEAYKSMASGPSKDPEIRDRTARIGGGLDSLENVRDSLVQKAAMLILKQKE